RRSTIILHHHYRYRSSEFYRTVCLSICIRFIVLCLFAFAFCLSPLIVNFYFAKREKERKSFCFF
ncbi:MAG: hypothetical protein ACI90V_009463, partial [Bacillariaceae sp.]